MIQFHGGRVRLHHGDARQILKRIEDNSIDSVVTDPPYALESIKKRFGGKNAAPCKQGRDGSGSLRPNIEPICVARKPLSEKTIAANVLKWSTGGLNIDGCRVPSELPNGRTRHGGGINGNGTSYELADSHGQNPSSRWPANLLHDGSEEVLACFPESESTGGDGYKNSMFCGGKPTGGHGLGDSGSAARFFASFPLTEDDKRIHYSAKADFHDRAGASHPTVKPVALLQWLVRLITPKGGTCLDMFAGTGTTAEACFREGMQCILIEREASYIADIKRRMELMMCGPDERLRESIKARGLVSDPGPLFGGGEPMRKGREIGPTGLKE